MDYSNGLKLRYVNPESNHLKQTNFDTYMHEV